MNIREIKDLINLMNEHGLAEIELESEGMKIKLRKDGGGGERTPPSAASPAAGARASAAPSAEKAAPKAGQTIKSPMVGTFYAAPAPDADAYVKVGSKVEVGQVVCVIEAMKLMNEIKSEIRGVLTEIHVTNGDAVEFGQVLFSVT